MRSFLNTISALSVLIGFVVLIGLCAVVPYGQQFGAACTLFVTGMATALILVVAKKPNEKPSKR